MRIRKLCIFGPQENLPTMHVAPGNGLLLLFFFWGRLPPESFTSARLPLTHVLQLWS